jgi:hypothetical protein
MFEKKSRKFKVDYIVGLAIVLVGGGSISSGISLNDDAEVAVFFSGICLVIFGLLVAFYKGKF